MTVIDRTHWVAEGTRPPGQPGHILTAFRYPAIDDGQQVWIWFESELGEEWRPATTTEARTFTPGPEWLADCTHGDAIRYCDTESECRTRSRKEP